MDDPNNPSIPASKAFPTPESAVPEMPMPGPITTSTTTSTPTSTTTSTTTTIPTTPDLPPVLPMAPEVEWPGSKPKSKLPQILGGIAAIILVVGVATAAYFVSNRISGRQAVAPTAPESQPLAKKKKEDEEEVKKKWVNPKKKDENIPGYECNDSNCPGPEFRCKNGNTCINVANPNENVANDEDNCGGTGNQCNAGETCKGGVCVVTPATPTPRPTLVTVLPIGPTSIAPTGNVCTEGATSCADNHKYVCRSNKWIADGPCVTATGTPAPTNPKPPAGVCTTGNVKCVGSSEFECINMKWYYLGTCGTTPPEGPIVTPEPTKKPGGGGGGCKEQCPRSDGVLRSCTPPEADGSSNDSLCNEAGRVESCGGSNFCCPSAGGTWTTNMAACTATCVPSSWTPDPSTVCIETGFTQTSNCEGVTRVVTGTKVCTAAVVPGACMEVTLYAQTTDGYSTAPMTTVEKNSLHVGDKIRIGITGSKADLQARFRVYINNVVETPEWKLGQAYSDDVHKKTYYSDYEIKKSGNYKFEGQVTTEP